MTPISGAMNSKNEGETQMNINQKCASFGFCLALGASGAMATEMVYVPLNPSFGGNPLNGSVLLGSAQATNKHKENNGLGGSSLLNRSPLQQFNETLERAVLSQLASAATSRVIGTDGRLIPGTVETQNFRITILDIGNGFLRITTTDRVTGASTSFEVGP